MNRLTPPTIGSSDVLADWEATTPSTESDTRAIDVNRLRRVSEGWRRIGRAAVMLVATTTSSSFPFQYRNRFGLLPEDTATVLLCRAMPAKHRITLAEARRRALAALDLAEDRRRRIRDEEARRWQLLDAIA